jgi:NADH-quinone oxidoreductase subunit C
MSDDSRKPSDPGQPPTPSPTVTPPVAAAGAESKPAAPPAAAAARPVAAAAPPVTPAAGAAVPPRPAPKPASAAAGASAAPPKAAEHPPRAAAPSGPPDPPPPADKTPPAFVVSLQAAVPGVGVSYWVGDWTVIVPAPRILDVARHLRDAPEASFDMCSDVTATDWPPRAERFDLVYCLYSTRHRHRLRVKAKVGETEPVASVTGVWPSANWLEREVYDMFGVNFVGHPDRRRILMPEDWQGFPERKDYPLEGPGELLMENPLDWLKLSQARDEADIE